MTSQFTDFEIIRAAGIEEIPAAARILLGAFDGNENARLGLGYARAFLRSFINTESRALHVARENGRVIGFAASERSDLRAERYRQLRPAAAAAFLRRPWLLANPDVFRMVRQRLTLDDDDRLPLSWFLTLIAVDPETQGRGIGRRLLSEFEDEGRRRGFDRATLFVRTDNSRARGLYERAGWRERAGADGVRAIYETPLAVERSQPIARAR